MSTSLDDALGQPEETVVETPPVEAQPAEAPEAPEAPEVTEDPVAEVVEKPEPMVPVGVVQGLRQEIRDLKAALPPPAPEPVPDVLDDPEGYVKHVDANQQKQTEMMRLNMSEDMVRMSMGDEVVDAALSAFESLRNTPKHQEILGARNPFKELVTWHKQQQAIAEIGDDPEAYKARVRAEVQAELNAQAVVKEVRAVPAAPSLADEPSIGARAGPGWAGPTPLSQVIRE